jgi:AcrR family transcriptional regulator
VKETMRKKMLETKRQLVLDEVAHLFEKEGFATLKMQEIAKWLDMSVGALYKLFDSKEALYYAYIDRQIRLFHQALTASCQQADDPKICLQRFIRMKFDVFRAKRKAIEDPVVGDPLFFFKMNAHHNDPARPIYEFLAWQFERLHEARPLEETNMMKLAYLFNAHTTGYVEYWYQYHEGFDISEEQVLARFLNGMWKR